MKLEQPRQMRSLRSISALVALLAVSVRSLDAQAQSMPDAGWQATFAPGFHNVSGTVTVVDEDTLEFDDFTYDGGGIIVYFYLGETNTSDSFRDGLEIGDELFGTSFDGTQPAFEVDLPAGSTIDGYKAISVWCVAAGVSFSSGTFESQPVPEPATCTLALVALGFGVVRWRRSRRRHADQCS